MEGDLVMRDEDTSGGLLISYLKGLPRPKFLPCTKATKADSRRMKLAAMNLCKYDESEAIYEALMNRLQRMIDSEGQLAEMEQRYPIEVPELARRLRDFLSDTSQGRIRTGEGHRYVNHELEWAEWVFEAARTGVMHIKTAACNCRAEWTRPT